MSDHIKIKTLRRTEWTPLHFAEIRSSAFDAGNVHGEIAFCRFSKDQKPHIISCGIQLAAHDMTWLQLLPENENWACTVIMDRNGKIVESYFDVTRNNIVCYDGSSSFEDLFLDVVYDAEGKCSVLDRDELDAALQNGVIDAATHEMVLQAGEAIQCSLRGRYDAFEAFLYDFYTSMM